MTSPTPLLLAALGFVMCVSPGARAAIQHVRPPRPPSLASRFVFYPGLNQAEKELVAKKPRAAFEVYRMKQRAEEASHRHFPNQLENDEGDAFRHFVWAGLLTRALGPKLAWRFLDAHEARPGQSAAEEQMDRFNNARGQRAALDLLAENAWSQRNLEAAGLDALRGHALVVITPRY